MGTIVVAYSGKAEGHAALRRASEEAGRRSGRLIVVDTRPPEERNGEDPHLAAVEAELSASGVGCEIRLLDPEREVADEVIELAEADDAEMVVIGLRRRSPVGKLMLGTNAQRILLDASCPVLTVKSAPDAPSGQG